MSINCMNQPRGAFGRAIVVPALVMQSVMHRKIVSRNKGCGYMEEEGIWVFITQHRYA